MNLLHLKYAVIVAETNSMTKAAEMLFTAQPNLSRAIKELESGLGITIFRRTPKAYSPPRRARSFWATHARYFRRWMRWKQCTKAGLKDTAVFAFRTGRGIYRIRLRQLLQNA